MNFHLAFEVVLPDEREFIIQYKQYIGVRIWYEIKGSKTFLTFHTAPKIYFRLV